MLRTKANHLLFNILNDLNINEDFDLKSISYAMEKSTKLVQKIGIHFKTDQVADQFFKHVENIEKFKDLFKNLVENGLENSHNNHISNSSLSDSIYILPLEDSFDVSTNQQLCMETSYYDTDFRQPFNAPQNIPLAPTTTPFTNHDEVSVEFYSSTPINANDLEIILLFLENSKQSGGGDSIEHTLDSSKHLLTIKYEESVCKERLIKRRVLEFQKYKLIASQPFNELSFKNDNRSIVLMNVSDKMSQEAVQLFAENLVVNDQEGNDVEQLKKSIFFQKVYLITFKLAYNVNKLETRLKRKTTMFNETIRKLQCYVTSSILVRKIDRKGQALQEEYVELYFTNKKRCGVDSYLSMRERGDFWIVTFEDEQSIVKILSQEKHMIDKQELLIESLVNFEILQQGVKKSEPVEDTKTLVSEAIKDTTFKAQEQFDTVHFDEVKNDPLKAAAAVPEKQDESLQANDDKIQKEAMARPVIHNDPPKAAATVPEKKDEPLQVKDSKIQKETKTRPVIVLTISDVPNLKVLELFDEAYLKQLTDELFDLDAALIISKSKALEEIRIECSLENLSNTQNWHKTVHDHCDNFFDQFHVLNIQIENVDNVLKSVKYDKMRVECMRLGENNFKICGFKDLVKKLAEDILNEETKHQQSDHEIIEVKRTGFQLYEIRVLFVNKFIKQMKDKFPNLTIKIEAKSLSINFNGIRSEIKAVNDQIDSIVESIKTINYPADDLLVKLIENKEMDVVSWLKDKDILCALEPVMSKNIIKLHSNDPNQLEKCRQAFKNEIVKNEIDANLFLHIGSDQELREFLQTFDKESGVIVIWSNSVIRICGFSDKANEVYNKCIRKM
jgi:hypothetical protein